MTYPVLRSIWSGIGVFFSEDCKVTLEVKPGKVEDSVVHLKNRRNELIICKPPFFHLRDKEHQIPTTGIIRNESSLYMIEHLFALFLFFPEFQFEVNFEGKECPMLDGSAKPFYDFLQKASFHLGLKQKVKQFTVDSEGEWHANEVIYQWQPSDHFEIDYCLKYNQIIQKYHFQTEPSGLNEFMAARTFIEEKQFQKMQNMGYLLKAGPENGIMFKTNSNESKFELLNGEPLRFENEFAMHKVLDFMGDLALYQFALPRLKISITNGGHFTNHQFIERILNV